MKQEYSPTIAKVWVVEMLRWGDRELHSYVEGVYGTEAEARVAGEEHREWRGGKYEPHIEEFELNSTQISRVVERT